jgi:hypothetical protein
MPKYDSQYRIDSPNGQEAIKQLQKLSVGESINSFPIQAISLPAQWKMVEKSATRWKLEGTFCEVPLYTLTVEVRENRIGMKVEEPS